MSHTNASDGESGPSGHPRWKEAFGSAFSSRGAVSKPLPGDEYAILQNAETFRVLFNTMTEGFALHEIICDDNGKPIDYRFLAINPAFEALTGLKRKDVVGSTHNELLPDNDAKWVRIFGEVALTGNPIRFENYSPALKRYYEIFAYRPAPQQFAVLFTDITRRKESEAQLEAMASFPEKSLNPVFRVGCDGKVLFANDASRPLLEHWKTGPGGDVPTLWRERVEEVLETRVQRNYDATYENKIFSCNLTPVAQANWVNVYCADVTSLRQAQRREAEALAAVASARAASNVLEAMEEGVLMMELSGVITSVNPAMEQLTGMAREQMVGRNIGDLLPAVISPDELGERRDHLRELRQGRIPDIRPFTLHSRDGRSLPVVPSTSFIIGPNGEKSAIVLTIHDVSLLKQTEDELRSTNVLLERIFDNTHISIAYLDREFRLVKANQTYADACQLPVESLIGNRLFDLYPNTENEMIFRSVLESGQRFIAHEQPFEFPDHPEWGTTYWDWSLQPVEDSNGQIDGLVYCLQDMTERKQAQTKIFESEKKYRQLVESSRSVILRRTVDGRITFLNQFGQEFFGYSQDEILGMNMLGSIVPNSESCGQFLENQVLDLAQDPDSSSTYEQEGMLKNGRRVWLQWTSWALRNDRGEIIEILSIGNDVTERKRLEDRNNAINSLLALFASKNSRKDYLDSVVELIRDWSGCNCVGVRVRNAEDFIPYEACVGFPMEFQALENRLRLTKNSCTCVRVVAQAFEPQDSSMVNPQGSFCCNCLPEFLQSLSENEKKNCRSACRNFGFSSITVVPVRFRDDVLGAIHLADPRSDMVAPQMVQFLEMISPIIGEAIHRFNVEEERREYEARLKSLADRLAKTEEDGRRKISQQLHDTVIQTLSMSNIRLGTLRKILVRFPKKDHVVQLDEARSLLQDSIQQCRDLISDLTPPLLYEIGLGAAIEEMAARTQQKYGVLIDVNANLEGYHVDKSLRGLLYQSANEFVANALKHGSPSRIFISVQVARETITLLVRDDGCGFQSSAWKMERSEGFGLFNIRERIEGLGGRCEISSVPGKGTIATISVPALGSRTGAEIAEDEHLSRS